MGSTWIANTEITYQDNVRTPTIRAFKISPEGHHEHPESFQDERIDVRASTPVKQLLQAAARACHKNVSEFLLDAGVTAAVQIENVRLVVADVLKQPVPDWPLAVEAPAPQGFQADLPTEGNLPFGHHGIGHLLLQD